MEKEYDMIFFFICKEYMYKSAFPKQKYRDRELKLLENHRLFSERVSFFWLKDLTFICLILY